MVKGIPYKIYEYSSHKNFKFVAENFSSGAEIAYEYEYYNAAGVLLIHAAIALADAVSIKLSSKKCRGENHYQVISLLSEVVPPDKSKVKALNHFKELIDHKNAISYAGDIYLKSDVDILLKHYKRFSHWALIILDSD